MTRSLPSLALEMSPDGIALHQLAFDGHWHELARVALTDAALRERLSNMRSIALKLEGRGFKVRIWLPEDQVILENLPLGGSDDKARRLAARAEIARLSGGKPSDYTVQIGEPDASGAYALAAVRIKTLQEASAFAKSHGFKGRSYGTGAAVTGFATPPVFEIPTDKVKAAALGVVAAGAAALVLGGGLIFYTVDPFNLWETPPKAADFAPFQQPNPAIERAIASPALKGLNPAPDFPVFSGISVDPARFPLPYLPPRQLVAEALETVLAPVAPVESSPPDLPVSPPLVAVNWPAPLTPLSAASGPDATPAIGLYNITDQVADLATPEIETVPPAFATLPLRFSPPARPLTVANTPFYLEPLPAMATRLSPDALAEFASRSGLTVTQLSRMASPILLIESKVLDITAGLPPILPRLRSGQAIPPQVAAPVPAPASQQAGPAPLFALLEGRPEIVPALRPAPAATLPPEAPEAITDAPVAPALIDARQADAGAATATDTDTSDAALATAVNAAIQQTTGAAPFPAVAPEIFALISGQPSLLPRLRSGDEVPALDLPAEIAPEVSPAIAEANALRPRRRPQAIIELPPELDEPTISGAAPAIATRPARRSDAFAANAARIIELNTSRPRVSAPVVPADPQTVSLPSSASVARAATIENAINLGKTNLIGVYGAADNRTALIMLSGRRMVRVKMGESFSGWTVVALTETTVRIRKRNREEILRMPAE